MIIGVLPQLATILFLSGSAILANRSGNVFAKGMVVCFSVTMVCTLTATFWPASHPSFLPENFNYIKYILLVGSLGFVGAATAFLFYGITASKPNG